MKVIFFDTECKQDPTSEPYSFDRPEELGLTVAATMEKNDGEKQWLDIHAPALCEYLASADVLVGFNQIKFDLPLVEGESLVQMHGQEEGMSIYRQRSRSEHLAAHLHERCNVWHVDMFLDIQASVGRQRGTGLKPVSQATIGQTAPMSGDHAPVAWADQRLLEVIEYCAIDVRLSRGLFNHMLRTGKAKRPDSRGEGPPPIEFDVELAARNGGGTKKHTFKSLLDEWKPTGGKG